MRDRIAHGEQMPMPGLYRGKDGIYTIHFFAYPALAALTLTLPRRLCLLFVHRIVHPIVRMHACAVHHAIVLT